MRYFLTAIALTFALTSNVDARSKTKKVRKQIVPAFSAKSFLIADATGTIIEQRDIYQVLPIASITKLMVGLLASKQFLNEELSIPNERDVQSIIPRKTETLSRKELLTLALVKSDNFAAQILCKNIPNCVDAMNDKAKELGMVDTHYSEPTGLSVENISTANDLLKLMLVAAEDDTLKEISSMSHAEIPIDSKIIKINNTNPLTRKFDIILSKTGYTNPAGGCLVMIMNSPVGQRILILLGSRNAKTRIPDMERLVKSLD